MFDEAVKGLIDGEVPGIAGDAGPPDLRGADSLMMRNGADAMDRGADHILTVFYLRGVIDPSEHIEMCLDREPLGRCGLLQVSADRLGGDGILPGMG